MNEEAANHERRDLLELVLGYILILIVLWTPRPWQRILYCAAALYLLVTLCRSFEGWAAMGLRAANFARTLWIVAVAALMAIAAALIARHEHTLNPDGVLAFLQRYWGYTLWAFAQQVLLQDFFLARFRRLIRSPGLAAFAAALTFSLAHLPNPILTAITFVWGLAACLLFLRYRNLYPLAIAHAIFGIAIATTIPGTITHNMRVGLGYLTYPAHHPGYRNH